MFTRFLIYGALGWIVEIVWTGLGSVLRRDPRLRAQTYLWMFPIYGGGALLFESLYTGIAAWPWLARGATWAASIFALEYIAGAVLRWLTGACPWDYSGTRFSVHGLIRLDYLPAWFVLGLLFERAHAAVAAIATLLAV